MRFPDADQIACVSSWLKHHDKEFWVKKTTIIFARNSAPVALTAKKFREIVSSSCIYWKSKEFKRRQENIATCLDDDGWDAIKFATRKHRDVLVESDSTFEFCVLFLRSQGIVCSKRLLMNSSAFHRITENKYRRKS